MSVSYTHLDVYKRQFDSRSRFQDVCILCKIGFIIFEAAKSAFNHDVVCPAAFSIHTLALSLIHI